MCSSTCELKQFAKVATEQFRATIYNFGIGKIPTWHQGANEASADWNSWHHSSYAAFCRNRGCHSTATIGWRDWNEEMIHSMVNDLSPLWSGFESFLEKHKDNLRTDTEAQIEHAVEHLGAFTPSKALFGTNRRVQTTNYKTKKTSLILSAKYFCLDNSCWQGTLRCCLGHIRKI
jgi:hypothetical protein